MIAGSGSKKAVCSLVPAVRTVRITRVDASLAMSRGSRPSSLRSKDSQWEPIVPPKNVTGRGFLPSRDNARATLFPLPPTTSRTADPDQRPRRPNRYGQRLVETRVQCNAQNHINNNLSRKCRWADKPDRAYPVHIHYCAGDWLASRATVTLQKPCLIVTQPCRPGVGSAPALGQAAIGRPGARLSRCPIVGYCVPGFP